MFGRACLSGFSDTCLDSVWCLVELVCLVLVIHVLILSGRASLSVLSSLVLFILLYNPENFKVNIKY